MPTYQWVVVSEVGFEPTTSPVQGEVSTRLTYTLIKFYLMAWNWTILGRIRTYSMYHIWYVFTNFTTNNPSQANIMNHILGTSTLLSKIWDSHPLLGSNLYLIILGSLPINSRAWFKEKQKHLRWLGSRPKVIFAELFLHSLEVEVDKFR